MTIGDRIRQRRQELSMTQDELAKRVGYASRSSINKLEMARILPSRKIELMAEALDCTPAYLMGWEDPQIIYPENAKNREQKTRLAHYSKLISKLSEGSQKAIFDFIDFQTQKEFNDEPKED